MSIKSTFDIDRATAINVIISKLNSCTNQQIGNILEEFEESNFRNYNVQDELDEDPEEYRTIRTLSEF